MQYVLDHCPGVSRNPNIHFRIQLAASVFSHIRVRVRVRVDQWPGADGSQACTCHHHVLQKMWCALGHELFQFFSKLLFPLFWFTLILVSSVQRTLFQNWAGFFRCFWLNQFWSFYFWGWLMVCTFWWVLCIYSHEVLFMVGSDTDTPTSWRVFFTMKRILQSSTTVIFRGHLGLLEFLSSPVTNCWFGDSWYFHYLSDGFLLFSAFWVNVQLLLVPWKRGSFVLKSCNS